MPIHALLERVRALGAIVELIGPDRIRVTPGAELVPQRLMDEMKARKDEVLRALAVYLRSIHLPRRDGARALGRVTALHSVRPFTCGTPGLQGVRYRHPWTGTCQCERCHLPFEAQGEAEPYFVQK